MNNGINFTKILSGFNKTLTLANKAIPVYKQVKPVIGNAKNVINVFKSTKEASAELANEQAKSLVRPIEVPTKIINNDRSDLNLDTLTFFQ